MASRKFSVGSSGTRQTFRRLTIETSQAAAKFDWCLSHSALIASFQAIRWQTPRTFWRNSRQIAPVGCLDSGGPAARAIEASITKQTDGTFLWLIGRASFQQHRDTAVGH